MKALLHNNDGVCCTNGQVHILPSPAPDTRIRLPKQVKSPVRVATLPILSSHLRDTGTLS